MVFFVFCEAPLVLKVYSLRFFLSSIFFLKVSQFEKQLSSATLVCLDGNIPVSTIDYVCSIASKHNVNGEHGEMVTEL